MIASLFSSSTHSPPPSPSLKPSLRRPPITLSTFHTLPQPLPLSSSHTPISSETSPRWLQKFLLQSVAAALSFSVLAFPLPFLAAEPPGGSSPPAVTADICREEEEDAAVEAPTQSVTNEGLVDEAWEVVDQGFFAGAASRPWSPEIWQEKKEYLHNSNIQTRSKAHEIIQKMLASLGDPYTRFLSPSEFSKMARYDVTGIGINLREFPDDHGTVKLKVLGIILDGPAHSAGVRQGDELLSVNGVNVKGKSAFDVSSLLQGPKETFVTIEVKHGNCGPIQSIRVQRQPAARTPVFYRLEKNDKEGVSVGYIHIKEFNALARKDLITALKRLQDSGAAYVVLDLRDNLGGLVQVGVEVAKLFLNEGETVTYTAGRDPQVQKSIIADAAPLVTSPVIVLVNNRTASASEIVASALHDNCRAVLVGERTYGKGLIQSVFELLDGSGVVVTIGKYVTPNHKDINGNGIVPDFSSLPALSEVTDYISRCQIGKAG